MCTYTGALRMSIPDFLFAFRIKRARDEQMKQCASALSMASMNSKTPSRVNLEESYIDGEVGKVRSVHTQIMCHHPSPILLLIHLLIHYFHLRNLIFVTPFHYFLPTTPYCTTLTLPSLSHMVFFSYRLRLGVAWQELCWKDMEATCTSDTASQVLC